MLTLVFDRFCWAKLYLNAALVEMAEEPRAHGFRPNEAWDRSLEERAEDVSVWFVSWWTSWLMPGPY